MAQTKEERFKYAKHAIENKNIAKNAEYLAKFSKANAVDLPELISQMGFNLDKGKTFNDTTLGRVRLWLNSNNVWLATIDESTNFNACQLITKLCNLEPMQAADYIIENLKANPALADVARTASQKNNQNRVISTPTKATESTKILGNSYLKSRGISVDTFEKLIAQGAVAYAEDGIAFIGLREDGAIGLTETRLFAERTDQNGSTYRHQVRGSRSNPTIITGSQNELAIVEGGFDGMALYEMARRNGDPVPTIIISGGKDSSKFLKNKSVVRMLMAAQKITIWGDNEVVNREDLDDPRLYDEALKLKQDATDAANRKRIINIKSINKTPLEAEVIYDKPPAGQHDLADWNLSLKAEDDKVLETGEVSAAEQVKEVKAKREIRFF